jgi:hypothetical protein
MRCHKRHLDVSSHICLGKCSVGARPSFKGARNVATIHTKQNAQPSNDKRGETKSNGLDCPPSKPVETVLHHLLFQLILDEFEGVQS